MNHSNVQARIDVAVGELGQRVTGLEAGLQGVVGEIRNLSSKIDDRSRPQYPLLVSIAGFFLAFAGSLSYTVINPINSNQARLELSIEKIVDGTVTHREFDQRLSSGGSRIERMEQDIKALSGEVVYSKEFSEYKIRMDTEITTMRENSLRELGRIDRELATIRSDMVSRSEHQTHWNETNDRLNALSARLNDMQREFGANYTIGDQIKNLQDQIKILQAQIVRGAGTPEKQP